MVGSLQTQQTNAHIATKRKKKITRAIQTQEINSHNDNTLTRLNTRTMQLQHTQIVHSARLISVFGHQVVLLAWENYSWIDHHWQTGEPPHMGSGMCNYAKNQRMRMNKKKKKNKTKIQTRKKNSSDMLNIYAMENFNKKSCCLKRAFGILCIWSSSLYQNKNLKQRHVNNDFKHMNDLKKKTSKSKYAVIVSKRRKLDSLLSQDHSIEKKAVWN